MINFIIPVLVLHVQIAELPDLHAAGAESGERGRDAVIDVRAQRMQRHAAFHLHHRPAHLGTTKATGAANLNAFCTPAHGLRNRVLHSAAVGNSARNLLGNTLADQRGVDFRHLDLFDLQVHLLRDLLFQLLPDPLDVLAGQLTKAQPVDRSGRQVAVVRLGPCSSRIPEVARQTRRGLCCGCERDPPRLSGHHQRKRLPRPHSDQRHQHHTGESHHHQLEPAQAIAFHTHVGRFPGLNVAGASRFRHPDGVDLCCCA